MYIFMAFSDSAAFFVHPMQEGMLVDLTFNLGMFTQIIVPDDINCDVGAMVCYTLQIGDSFQVNDASIHRTFAFLSRWICLAFRVSSSTSMVCSKGFDQQSGVEIGLFHNIGSQGNNLQWRRT